MNAQLAEIICFESTTEGLERLKVLRASHRGWGMRGELVYPNDTLGLFRVSIVDRAYVIAIIGDVVHLEPGILRLDPLLYKEGLRELLIDRRVPKEQILVLKGEETPQEIDVFVRKRFRALLEKDRQRQQQ